MATFIRVGTSSVNLESVSVLSFQTHRGQLEITIHFDQATKLVTGEEADALYETLSEALGEDCLPPREDINPKPSLNDSGF